MSSTINSLTAVFWEDLLKWKFAYLSEDRKTVILKILAFFFGGLGTAVAFAASQMRGTVLQAAKGFNGATIGPLLGIFLLGGLFPQANWIGAITGAFCGLGMTMWISIGAYSKRYGVPMLPTDISNCTAVPANFTYKLPTTRGEMLGISKIYTISYLWYSSVGLIITLVVGLLVSCATGCSRNKKTNPKYLIPICDRLCCCLPNKILQKLRFGFTSDTGEDMAMKQQYTSVSGVECQ